MRLPRACYQMKQVIAQYFSHLRPAQREGLALWVYGTVVAQSGCLNAILTVLEAGDPGSWHNRRQYLREWLYDGADKSAPCATQVEVQACFAPLLSWVLDLWQDEKLALAVDVTNQRDELVVITVSVLYRSCAIPVAWKVLPAQAKESWMEYLCHLMRLLAPVIPKAMTVLVLADRGLRSPRLWQVCRQHGWHLLLRLCNGTYVRPQGGAMVRASTLVRAPGQAWVGKSVVFKDPKTRQEGTLIVLWATAEEEPWVLLSDLSPQEVGVCWYGLRMWIELGFRAIKSLGWQWQRTRRTDPERVERHWLVLALATLWTLAVGTRMEDAQLVGKKAEALHAPLERAILEVRTHNYKRHCSLFRFGLMRLQKLFLRGRLWCRLWLMPTAWPTPPPDLMITFHTVF